MRRLARFLLSLAVVGVAAFVTLFLVTRGDYPVVALVTDDPTLPQAEVAGITLHLVRLEGPEGAETVIVLHGGPGGDFRSLRALEALSATHHVVFYDQRGAGLSERVDPARLTLDGYLEELGGVIERVSPDRPVWLIGHSWGAMLATAYLGHAPEQVIKFFFHRRQDN